MMHDYEEGEDDHMIVRLESKSNVPSINQSIHKKKKDSSVELIKYLKRTEKLSSLISTSQGKNFRSRKPTITESNLIISNQNSVNQRSIKHTNQFNSPSLSSIYSPEIQFTSKSKFVL